MFNFDHCHCCHRRKVFDLSISEFYCWDCFNELTWKAEVSRAVALERYKARERDRVLQRLIKVGMQIVPHSPFWPRAAGFSDARLIAWLLAAGHSDARLIQPAGKHPKIASLQGIPGAAGKERGGCLYLQAGKLMGLRWLHSKTGPGLPRSSVALVDKFVA